MYVYIIVVIILILIVVNVKFDMSTQCILFIYYYLLCKYEIYS